MEQFSLLWGGPQLPSPSGAPGVSEAEWGAPGPVRRGQGLDLPWLGSSQQRERPWRDEEMSEPVAGPRLDAGPEETRLPSELPLPLSGLPRQSPPGQGEVSHSCDFGVWGREAAHLST